MTAAGLRRSSRLNTYDSNGRDFLANNIDWTREELEGWITSPTVQPHLLLWYRLCVTGARRFNDAIEWINTGEQGYFYNPDDLEEDLLLMCLGEGIGQKSDEGFDNDPSYADEQLDTGKWITQELWARTAWRVAQANAGKGQAFETRLEQHPAACYAFIIDVLCIAFHSIAFRGEASVYEQLLNGSEGLTASTKLIQPTSKLVNAIGGDDTASSITSETATSTNGTSSSSSITDFEDEHFEIPAKTEEAAALDRLRSLKRQLQSPESSPRKESNQEEPEGMMSPIYGETAAHTVGGGYCRSPVHPGSDFRYSWEPLEIVIKKVMEALNDMSEPRTDLNASIRRNLYGDEAEQEWGPGLTPTFIRRA